MDAALIGSAALMGIAGAPHCAAMCGAAFGAVGGSAQRAAVGAAGRTAPRTAFASASTVALHVGRASGYAAAGAAVALGVGSLDTLGVAAPLLRPLWAMVHVAAIVLGVWLLATGRLPAWLSALPRAVRLDSQPVRVVRRLPAPARAGLVGACWVGMPCGLLQSALLVAALASGPAQGAGVMAAFAIASAPGLWLGPALWQRLARRRADTRAAAWSVRAAGALLAGASTFALWHGLGAAIADALCRAPA